MNIFVNPTQVKHLKLADVFKESSKADWKEIIEIHHYKTRTHIFYQNLEKLPKVVGALKVYHKEQVVEHIKHSEEFKVHSTYYSEIKMRISENLS